MLWGVVLFKIVSCPHKRERYIERERTEKVWRENRERENREKECTERVREREQRERESLSDQKFGHRLNFC